MKNINETRKYLIDRLGYFRNKANLSARELSLQLDKSIAYIAKFENGDFSIPTEVLINAIEICGGKIEEFFWEDIRKYNEQKELINNYEKLSNESKETIKNLIRNLK